MASQESNVSTITTRTCLDPMEKNTKNYNSSSREGSTSSLAAVLLAGRDLAKQLQLLDHHHHHHPIPSRHSSLSVDHEEDKSGEQQSTCRQGVTQKILESYDNALSLLSHYRLEEVVATTPSRIEDGADGGDLSLHSQSPGFKIPPPLIRGAYKRRVLPKQTRQVEVTVSPGTTLDDGFSWRKYGQKEILGLKHPRCYYRCTHRHAQGCLATKQVQREDGNLFQVTYIGSHTCLSGHGKQEASVVTWSPSPASSMTTCREGSPLFFDTWSPPPASSVMTCGEGSPLFFDDSEFGEVEEEEEEEAAHAPVLRPQSRTKSQLCDLLQKQTASRVPAFPSSYSSASRFEEIRPELEEFSEVRLIDLDAYDLYGDSEENDGTMLTSHEATNLNLDLGLGMSSNKSTNLKGSLRIRASLDLGNGMSSAPNSGMTATDLDLRLGMMMSSGMPTNFRGSLGSGPNLDLGIGMSIVSGSGVVQSLQSQVVSCFQLQDVNKKVSDGLLGMAEPIQMEVKDNATLSECTSHCNSIMNTGKQLYISKSPSQKTICAHNFVSLFFPYCNLPQLWKGGEQLLLSLKRFDANHSNLLWIPNLSKAQKLESLNLEGCTNLVGISSIQYLIKLQHLNLKGCRSLKGIPSLIRLKQLKTFDLSDCSNLIRLPPSLGCLPNLSELNLKNCAKLANLPRSVIHLMKSLETLNISGCSSMWKTIGEDEDGTVPLPTKPHFGVSIMPSSGATHQETLPNSDSEIPAAQVDAVAEGSPLQDLSLDLKDIRGKKAIELEEEACTGTPLIISLLSELGAAILFPPDVGSSHASSSSSQDINIQALNHTENNKSAAEESKVAAVLQREDHQQQQQQQQQLCNDHDNAKTDQKELPSAGDEQKFCQVEDCQVKLTGAEAYYQQHKICEVHCMATAALLGNILQRFCQQCCRFHVLSDFNEEERNCRSRVAGYHQKQRRQSSTTTTATEEEHPSPETDSDAEINIAEPEDENGKCSLHKRTRTIEAPEQNQPTQAVEQQSSCSPFNDWDEASAIGDIEERVLEMIEQISRSNYNGDEEKAAAAVPESVVAWLAEMEESIPETVRSMKSAKAKAAADSEEWKAVDARLVVGELELRLLDMELTRISKEEEEIEAELQRLMEKKRELSQQH